MSLNDTFTSTGHKFFAHEEAMKNLRNGKGQCVVTHCMITDVCQHVCAFCSVQARTGDVLPFDDIMAYLDILLKYGLKAVILSGGGNPILYKCKKTGKNFNDVVDAIHERGLEIGLITNGMPLVGDIETMIKTEPPTPYRRTWKGVSTKTLDKLTWIRISMAGLDHAENCVFVPDIDPNKTTLGFSYVAHDIYHEAADPHHGKVSTKADLLSGDKGRAPDRSFEDRIPELTEQISHYVETYKPKYCRVLPNCLEPNLIPKRCEQLQAMANAINPDVVFVQQKPPKAPNVCLIGVIHPVLNCDGFVYPCDAVVLAAAEVAYRNGRQNHKFDDPWKLCHWSKIGDLYENKLPRSLIHEPGEQCKGCVFTTQNLILEGVANGTIDPVAPNITPEHVNFV